MLPTQEKTKKQLECTASRKCLRKMAQKRNKELCAMFLQQKRLIFTENIQQKDTFIQFAALIAL